MTCGATKLKLLQHGLAQVETKAEVYIQVANRRKPCWKEGACFTADNVYRRLHFCCPCQVTPIPLFHPCHSSHSPTSLWQLPSFHSHPTTILHRPSPPPSPLWVMQPTSDPFVEWVTIESLVICGPWIPGHATHGRDFWITDWPHGWQPVAHKLPASQLTH